MKSRWLLAHGLCLSCALVSLPPAHAAPKKRAPTAAKKKKPAKAVEPEPVAEPPVAAVPTPAPEPETPPSDAPRAEPTALPSAAPAPAVAILPSASESNDDEARRVGRHELERREQQHIYVAARLSVDVGNRRFSYSDPVGSGYAPYRLPAAPMLTFGLEAYPAAGSGVAALRGLGFRGSVSRAFAFGSDTPQGAQLQTSWTRFSGELRQRFTFPGSHPLELGVFAGGASYFDLRTADEVPALLPSARTVALRFGVDTRVRVAWRLWLSASAAYLHVTTPGEIYTHFRDPKLAGVDAELALGVALGGGLELRPSGRYTRYFADFSPQLGDSYVAGGAVDEQMQVGLGVRYAN